MGSFDLLFLLAQIALPLALALTGIADWRSFRRRRYLVLCVVYALLTLALAGQFYYREFDLLVCVVGSLWVVVAGLIHMKFRRADQARLRPPSS